MTQRPFSITIVLLALVIAQLLSQFLHEVAHAVAGIVVGATNVQVTLFAALADTGIDPDDVARVTVIEGSAVVANLVVGTIAAVVFRALWLRVPWVSYTAFLTAAFSFALGFGYLMFDGIFYQPGAAGDFKAILDLFDGNAVFRIAIIVIGTAGWMATLFWVSQSVWRFTRDESERVAVAMRLLLVPYLVSVAVMVPLAFLIHPLGVEGGFVVLFQYVFGNSLLLTGTFMSAYWLTYRAPSVPAPSL